MHKSTPTISTTFPTQCPGLGGLPFSLLGHLGQTEEKASSVEEALEVQRPKSEQKEEQSSHSRNARM